MFKEIKRLPFPLAGRMRPHEYSTGELRMLCAQAGSGDWSHFPARLVLQALFLASIGAEFLPVYDTCTGQLRGTRVAAMGFRQWWDRGWQEPTPWDIARRVEPIWGADGESLTCGGSTNSETLADRGQLPLDVLAMCANQMGLKFSLLAGRGGLTSACCYEAIFASSAWVAASPGLAAMCAVIAHAIAIGPEGSIWGEERAAGCPSSSGEVGS